MQKNGREDVQMAKVDRKLHDARISGAAWILDVVKNQ